MVNRIRRTVSQSKEDTASVLETGHRWESLRAGFWGGLNHLDQAIDCSNRDNEYQADLTNHLNSQNKDKVTTPFRISSKQLPILML